ncbi:fimbrial protein [Aeromonas salmonicida]|uniref:fimbrial protein n=1 Tax=Aeromonas salmonicida TaxID=645 RepID=UPI00192DE968|nr:fimbrial protein [Aeromonas salmonicida]MDR7021458.1 type 1 fimbria pilin [Aeromonas salmonicida]
MKRLKQHARNVYWSPARMALLLTTLSSALPAHAIDVFFTGTLVVPPPCVINGNNAISVDFGNDMLAGRIDGVNYEKPISYTLECTGATNNSLKLQFQGSGASFDSTVLTTSKTDLGLELRSDGSKLPLNSWLLFTDPARPVLTAVPVKSSGSTLSGGAFTATSTLLVDYQ